MSPGAAVERVPVPALERTAAVPPNPPTPSGPPGIWARVQAGPPRGAVSRPNLACGAGAAGTCSARNLQPGPPPSSAAPRDSGRSSGAVPAPGGSAPHTCLCPAPGDVAPSDWRAGGAEAGELTAAPRHWPWRRTRAVAGRRRYPEPSLCSRGARSRAGGAGLWLGAGRAGPRGGKRKTERRGARAASGGCAPESGECAAPRESAPGACDRGRRPAGPRRARGGGAGGARAAPGAWGARVLAVGGAGVYTEGAGVSVAARTHPCVQEGVLEGEGRECLRGGERCVLTRECAWGPACVDRACETQGGALG